MPPANVLLAHAEESTLNTLSRAVSELGHVVAAKCSTGAELVARGVQGEGDLIIAGVELPDFDGVTALIEISRKATIPAIVVTRQRSLELVERGLKDHVMAYLMEPVDPYEIKPAVHLVLKRFEQFQDLKHEISVLRQTIDDRQTIERAKAVLMRRHDISEEDAHKRLRRVATDHRIRMVEASRRVLLADQELND